jgi:hypothetical protein
MLALQWLAEESATAIPLYKLAHCGEMGNLLPTIRVTHWALLSCLLSKGLGLKVPMSVEAVEKGRLAKCTRSQRARRNARGNDFPLFLERTWPTSYLETSFW